MLCSVGKTRKRDHRQKRDNQGYMGQAIRKQPYSNRNFYVPYAHGLPRFKLWTVNLRNRCSFKSGRKGCSFPTWGKTRRNIFSYNDNRLVSKYSPTTFDIFVRSQGRKKGCAQTWLHGNRTPELTHPPASKPSTESPPGFPFAPSLTDD